MPRAALEKILSLAVPIGITQDNSASKHNCFAQKFSKAEDLNDDGCTGAAQLTIRRP